MVSTKFPLVTATVEFDESQQPYVFLHWHEGFRGLDIEQKSMAFFAMLNALGETAEDLLADVRIERRRLIEEMNNCHNSDNRKGR
jgi:hypothetical protein